jgi:hypothetical protein
MKHRLFGTAGATTTPFHQQSCGRCNGHMEQEMCMDLESDSGYSTCWVLRCLQCGDMVDETILQHRSLSNQELELRQYHAGNTPGPRLRLLEV